MPTLSEIGERLLTQDNRYTAEPMFCVQIKVRDIGYDVAYGEEYCWRDSANDLTIYNDDPDFKEEPEGDEWEQFGYVDRWETVMVALTEKGCEEYMERDGHNLRRMAFRSEIRIYVESFHRCREMIDLRAALKAGIAERKEVTSLTDAIRAFVTADAAWTTALRDHAMGRPSDISAIGAARHAAKMALYRIANPPEDAAASGADVTY